MEEITKIDLSEGQTQKQTSKLKFWKTGFFKKKWFLGLVLVIIFLLLAAGIPSLIVVTKVRAVYGKTLELKVAVGTRDLKLIQGQIVATRESLNSLDNSLKPLFWVRIIPFIGAYQQDAVHLVRAGEAGLEAGGIVIESIIPYADVIGFAGGEAEVGGGEKTAEDRISFIVTTLDKIGPDIQKVSEKLLAAKGEIDHIKPERYPETFRGQEIRKPLAEIIALVDQVATITADSQPLLEVTPWLLGNDDTRRYLVVFQNDAELRPTGGFMTAYALLEVEKGKVTPLISEDMYTADARFNKKIEAPEPIIAYLTPNIPYWKLRDMNLSPDFAVSMGIFSENFKQAVKQEFDGIIAVDTQVLVSFLEVLGPIGVSGWGNFSAEPDKRCDGCPQVVYELEKLADKPVSELRTARKAVIGPLMHSILANAFGSPKERLPGLFNAAFSGILEKHVLFYFPDEKIQKAVEASGFAGRIRDYDGDYFHLNDSNFAGAKANMFIKQTVSQKIEIANNGEVTKTVTVQYKNPSPHSFGCDLESGGLCLNAPYRDWFRLYVPKGSTLIEVLGSEVEVKTYEDLGKTVFEGYYGKKSPLSPGGGIVKLVFKYKLPFKVQGDEYKLLIQKQPGTQGHIYDIEIEGEIEEFELKGDKEMRFKI